MNDWSMKAEFINANGVSFPIDPPFYLEDLHIEGLSGLLAEAKMTKAPYQDGRTLIDMNVDERYFDLPFQIVADSREQLEQYRLLVNEVFNPKLGLGTLRITLPSGQVWCIDCVPTNALMPGGEARMDDYQEVLIPMVAPNPYLYDPTQIENIMIGFSGGFKFPFKFPFTLGTVGSQITVGNVGNIETPVMIYFYGEVVNPVIQNVTTEEGISIVKTIADGEILIINTAFGEKSAMILTGGEYVNAFEYVDPDSKFWNLVPGTNTLKYTASSEGANAQCRVYYYNRRSGV